ncbi:helix-turn-helix domain-containing protein [Sphingomonas sp. H39-1-10]|uniref:helix-turn-helix domain-containing protein n=1 Tax=Sphingomonas pollutisoli TaxID=3030829 RepID=UPI0023B8D1F9|nr:helix-turn-helix domain-containing protein [Sphingomonas pollutisoli]MDF0490944.1 helix-turn-helix domain-containing protein [Sphingomonas pollutisoli]
MGTYTLSTALADAFGYRQPRSTPARSGATHPTGARVLRDSVEAGTFEHVFFSPPAKGETDRLLRAARRLLDAGRQLRSEARQGDRTLTPTERLLTTLTSASVRVFEEILTLSRLNRGRVFPSYEYLAEATSLGRATVARGLTILERVGLLVRQRRFKRIEADGPGPRYEQTSNAYRAILPDSVVKYLPRWMRPAPLPDDALQYATDHSADVSAMRAQLTCREHAEALVGGSLGKVLAKLGAAIDRRERESQRDTEPHLNSLLIAKSIGLAGQ